MSKPYQIITRTAKESAEVIEQFCRANGQILLPIVDVIQSASHVVDTVIHEIGVETLEIILATSAEAFPLRDKRKSSVLWGLHSICAARSAKLWTSLRVDPQVALRVD